MTAQRILAARPAYQFGEAAMGLAFVLPIVVIMGGLVFMPLVTTVIDSFYRVDPMRAGEPFIGLRNYTDLMTDSNVQASWMNTFAYVVMAVVLETAGGLGAALLLNNIRRGRQWLLAATVLPWCLPPVVNAIVWMWIYNPSYGVLNHALISLGLLDAPRVWFNDRGTALFLVTLVHVWRMMPLTAIILLAALQSVPKELYEAAKLDGAGALKSFRLVTLPLISGGLAIALSQSTVFAFNLFDEAWIMGGSGLDTRSVIIQVYMSAFQNLRFSYGMALSLLAMIASLIVSMIYVLRVYRETRLD
ncbi:carbohydrate ABC transporter permease [Consotaella salsifontis]|uniref:Carbohydrate ABC transporter membrane protein 1, CUT1 family n=1 Tax=Consotaella salsifontis TaxID=1365950 RepID=A0A1T4RNK2_9HYPH|nr:sugar ABC transporter permease [Consotaella salsifontis]SKA17595.1 carbohydrate ABC transporter membrane protein 1, CUT1 family [Consotaella salsifontis]